MNRRANPQVLSPVYSTKKASIIIGVVEFGEASVVGVKVVDGC